MIRHNSSNDSGAIRSENVNTGDKTHTTPEYFNANIPGEATKNMYYNFGHIPEPIRNIAREYLWERYYNLIKITALTYYPSRKDKSETLVNSFYMKFDEILGRMAPGGNIPGYIVRSLRNLRFEIETEPLPDTPPPPVKAPPQITKGGRDWIRQVFKVWLETWVKQSSNEFHKVAISYKPFVPDQDFLNCDDTFMAFLFNEYNLERNPECGDNSSSDEEDGREFVYEVALDIFLSAINKLMDVSSSINRAIIQQSISPFACGNRGPKVIQMRFNVKNAQEIYRRKYEMKEKFFKSVLVSEIRQFYGLDESVDVSADVILVKKVLSSFFCRFTLCIEETLRSVLEDLLSNDRLEWWDAFTKYANSKGSVIEETVPPHGETDTDKNKVEVVMNMLESEAFRVFPQFLLSSTPEHNEEPNDESN